MSSEDKPWRLAEHDIKRITKDIHISNFETSLNIPYLKKPENNISVIVSMSLNKKTDKNEQDYIDAKIESHHVPIDDSSSQRIEDAINKVNKIIVDAIKNGKQILIHCDMGMSRAPTIVIGHLIIYNGLSYYEASTQVLGKRKGAKPNDNFHRQLLVIENKRKNERFEIMNIYDKYLSGTHNEESINAFTDAVRARLMYKETIKPADEEEIDLR